MSKVKRLLRINGQTEAADRLDAAEKLRAGVRPPAAHRSYIDDLLDEARADDTRERERQHADAVERQYQHIMRNGGKAMRAQQHALFDDRGRVYATNTRPLSAKPTKAYFAYGRNMNVSEMRRRCPDAKPVGAYVLSGYKLVFRNVADVVKHKGAEVLGVIWMISEKCEAALDRVEGYPRVYAKGTFNADVKGKAREVMFYRMNGRSLIAPPSETYLRIIMDGYASFKLDNTPLVHAAQAAYDAHPPMRPFSNVATNRDIRQFDDDDERGREEFF